MNTSLFYQHFVHKKLFLFLVMVALLCLSTFVYAHQPVKEPNFNNNPVSHFVEEVNGFTTIRWQLHEASRLQWIAIEKTTDFRTHQQVGLIAVKENTYAIEYTITKLADKTDSLCFRLKMTDITGKSSFSSYVVLSPLQTDIGLKIYPLPNNGTDIYLSFDQPLEQQVQVTIQDMFGMIHYSGSHHQPGNRLHIRFAPASLPLASGSYQVMVASGKYFSKKILLVE